VPPPAAEAGAEAAFIAKLAGGAEVGTCSVFPAKIFESVMPFADIMRPMLELYLPAILERLSPLTITCGTSCSPSRNWKGAGAADATFVDAVEEEGPDAPPPGAGVALPGLAFAPVG